MTESNKAEYESNRDEILMTLGMRSTIVDRVVTFETDELTAHCPFEFGGPDFYDLTIKYEPNEFGVESKSLKKYIEAWRNAEISAEDLAAEIYDDVHSICEPDRLLVHLEQQRRGGIEETVEVGDASLGRDD